MEFVTGRFGVIKGLEQAVLKNG
ncbi:hypothetical protein MED121_09755 [Marinomonas sp. MED121]|nr:hypothetical protein MED121_09755 [Marinomonas sp. MED121]